MNDDSLNTKCPICHSQDFSDLISFGEQPLCAHLYPSPDTEDILHEGRYIYCRQCHFVRIAKPVSLSLQYDSYEYFSSGLFPDYARDIAGKVLDFATDGRPGPVVEIGSNDGGFLQMLKDWGHSQVVGVEASKILAQHANSQGIETINRYFDEEVSRELREKHGPPRVILARYVLEHVLDLETFLGSLRALSDANTMVLIEVPDIDYILEYSVFTGFWDQHVCYFNLHTLSRLFGRFGFEMSEHSFDHSRSERVILAWFKPSDSPGHQHLSRTPQHLLDDFSNRVNQTLDDITKLISDLFAQGKRIAAYGASHNSTNVINYPGIGNYLQYALDKDERKAGKYLPGSKLKVMPSGFLDEDNPDYCLIAAVGAEGKIINQHRGYLQQGGKFITLYPLKIIEHGNEYIIMPVSGVIKN